jgi:hypothetical protein
MDFEQKAREAEAKANALATQFGKAGDGFVAKYIKPNLSKIVLAIVIGGLFVGYFVTR